MWEKTSRNTHGGRIKERTIIALTTMERKILKLSAQKNVKYKTMYKDYV